jgi:hypothetical protein
VFRTIRAAVNDWFARLDLCLREDSDGACTKDCGGGAALCARDLTLSAGTHTVRLDGDFDLSVTFTVPSLVSDGSLCDAMDR